MVRIAFCLYGLSYGNNGDSDTFLTVRNARITYDISYKYFKKNIFDNNENIDVFMHTWNNSKKADILNLYKPVSYIFENPIDFTNKPNHQASIRRIHSTHSMWHSIKNVINLKKKYESDNNFKYDYVFLTRFDITFERKLVFSSYNKNILYGGQLCNIYNKYGKQLESSSYFKIIKNMTQVDIDNLIHKPVGYGHTSDLFFHDLFFFSNTNFIDVFGLIFDNIPSLIEETKKMGNRGDAAINNCRWIFHHLKQYNLLDKIKLPFINNIDYGLVRRKYYNCTK